MTDCYSEEYRNHVKAFLDNAPRAPFKIGVNVSGEKRTVEEWKAG